MKTSLIWSHDSPAGSGATFGVEVDALWRWQTFEATKDGVIDNVEVYVVKRNPDIGKPGDLKAAIYPMDGASPLMKRCRPLRFLRLR